MSQTFHIEFEYRLNDNELKVRLFAIAEQGAHSSIFTVHSFAHALDSGNINGSRLLPRQDIRCLFVDGKKKWVDMGTQKETVLSVALGEAIEMAIS